MSERLLALPEVAEALGCSVSTVKRRVRSGELGVFYDGRLVRVRQADLDRYIAERVLRRSHSSLETRGTSSLGVQVPTGKRLWD